MAWIIESYMFLLQEIIHYHPMPFDLIYLVVFIVGIFPDQIEMPRHGSIRNAVRSIQAKRSKESKQPGNML
jgi:hypothetical protein